MDILTSVTADLLQTTSELASSAAQMAAALTQTTTTMEEVQRTAALSSEKAQHVLTAAQNAAQISQTGKQATEDTISEMQDSRANESNYRKHSTVERAEPDRARNHRYGE
jgi:methyl-accepting chemotaxis protein